LFSPLAEPETQKKKMPFKTRFKTTTVFGKRFANVRRREHCLLTYWVERRYGSRTVVSYLVSGSARGVV
jgi:hypothetical protein